MTQTGREKLQQPLEGHVKETPMKDTNKSIQESSGWG